MVKKCRPSLLLLYLVLLINYCTAQSKLEGFIIDHAGERIAYATLSLRSSDTLSSILRQADSTGHFVFTGLASGTYQLSTYALGYEKKTLPVPVSRDTVVNLVLHPLSGALKGVTVVENKPVIERQADRIIYDVAASISARGSNGLEALSQAPGILLNGEDITMAGKGSLSVMINGRLLHLSGENLVRYLKSLSAGQIAKIEVITHPPARYAAEGNAGLINIITRKSSRSGFSGEVQGSLSRFLYSNQPDYRGIKNYGYLGGSMDLAYNKNKWSLYANASYTPGRELMGYGVEVYYPDRHWAMGDTGEYRVITFNLLSGIDYKLSRHTTIGFEYANSYRLEDGADYVNVPVYNAGGTADSTLRTYATYYPIAKGNAFNVHLTQSLNPSGGKLAVNADYFNFYRHDRSDLETNSFMTDGKLNPAGTARYYDTSLQNIRIYTLKADVELRAPFARFFLGSKVSFINNYSNIYYYNKATGAFVLDSNLSNEFRYIENTQALYGSVAKNMGKWDMEAGLRAELTETAGTSYFLETEIRKRYLKLFPSLVISWKMNADNRFSFSYNKRIHRPTFWNLNPYKTLMTAYTYVEGNPYLEPEYITNAELSHTYKEWLTSALYLNVINNGFAQITIPGADSNYMHTTTMLNFISTRRFGISESVSTRPLRWLESSGQANAYYTLAYSDLPYIGDVKGFGLYVATRNTFFFNRAKTITGVVNVWCQFPEVDHIGRSDTYYSLDAGIQALVLHKKLSLSLNATDLLESSASTIHTTVHDRRETFTNFQIRRSVKFSASWHFGHSGKRERINTSNESERDRIN